MIDEIIFRYIAAISSEVFQSMMKLPLVRLHGGFHRIELAVRGSLFPSQTILIVRVAPLGAEGNFIACTQVLKSSAFDKEDAVSCLGLLFTGIRVRTIVCSY